MISPIIGAESLSVLGCDSKQVQVWNSLAGVLRT
ncbi:MAG: hypothetical protein BWX48_03741 [Verrucomicrobia bacterium ADurb.Bin006]|jgi:hypothetical protein|nr:MAG: hypothetical protein BWX48_03741 [Verrucomicrobia bacterium ADurb.Bin006]